MPAKGMYLEISSPTLFEVGCVVVGVSGLALGILLGWFIPNKYASLILLLGVAVQQMLWWRDRLRFNFYMKKAEEANTSILNEFTSTYIYAKMLADDPQDNPLRESVVNGFTSFSVEWEELLDDTDGVRNLSFVINGETPMYAGWRAAYVTYTDERDRLRNNINKELPKDEL